MNRTFLKVISSALFAIVVASAAFAHAGGRDIWGTILRFDRRVVVVKRTDGKSETVPLASPTVYRVGAVAGTWGDMRKGSRVVVHIGHDGTAIEIHLPARK
jgi:hypothetical protein